GPTSWEWTVNPSYGALFDNQFIANPKVTFLFPGEYDICLKTENANGVGTTKCKQKFISVMDDVAFCSSSESEFASGRITDEGGAGGIYTSNTSCDFIIRPCAGSITLKFSEFDLADAGDELRVYDGVNASAPLIGVYSYGSALPGGSY